MDVIDKFLVAMQAALFVKVAVFLILGVILVTVGVKKKNKWFMIAGATLAIGQFAWPWLVNTNHESEIAERRNYVANLPTVQLRADFPRRLVLVGKSPLVHPGWFIAAGYVDEVDYVGQRYVAAHDEENCRGAAMALLNPDPTALKVPPRKNLFQSLQDCIRVVGPASSDSDAIVLRIDGETTLHDRKNARRYGAPRAIQISLRQNHRETLVHYDEMPRLGYRSSAIQLNPSGYDNLCGEFAYTQITANFLDAAKYPERSSALLARGPVWRSKYASCIASKAPISEDEAQDRI